MTPWGRAAHLDSGVRAEDIALRYLKQRGLMAIMRNFRSKGGEIDLVMRDGTTTVFVEVRYRADDRYGSAAESINLVKQARVLAAARSYLQLHAHAADHPCRFDAVVLRGDLERPAVEWIVDAFQA